MPRVAVLFEYPSLNGGERSLLAAAERLRDHFDFVAFAPADGPLAAALQAAGFEVLPSPLHDERGQRLPRAAAIESLVAATEGSGAGLLHGNSLAMGRLTCAAASSLGVPCTAHLRDIVGVSAGAVEDLNGNARLVAVSDATRAFHVGQGVEPERVVVVHNGVDLNQFRPQESNAVQMDLGIPQDALVALVVGQIGLRKGWDVLAEAIASIAMRFPDLHVVLAGERYSEKEETIAYERAVRARFAEAIGARAHFIGYRHDMPELMNAADVLVHPARQEPFGRVLLEAAASGLPIVATAVGGTTELLADGVSALMVPPGKQALLAEAITLLLEDGPLGARLAAAARRRVEADFSAERSAERLAAVWDSALRSRDAGSQPK